MTPDESAAAIVEAFDGYLDQPLVIAAAVIDGDDVAVRASPESDIDGLFELGSIGKTMTAAVLGSLVLDGTLSLDDPVSRWLDAGDNSDVTLRQLATHTSGLPRLAPNAMEWPGFTMDDPYAGYTADLAEVGLRASKRENVGEMAYSNFGFQLLGLVECRATDLEFDDLVRQRLWSPLGMDRTCVGGLQGPRVQGYSEGKPTPHWGDLLPGPGGVDSTIGDMARYLGAVLAPPDDAAGRAIEFTVAEGLTWVGSADGLLGHNGGTGGFCAALAADRGRLRGGVAMVNSGDLREIDSAVALAVRGGDPREARPEPVGDDHDELAMTVARLTATAEWGALRDLMHPVLRDGLTVDRLGAAWTEVFGPRGAFERAEVATAHRAGGNVRVELTVTFEKGTGAVIAQFDGDRRLVSLRID